METRRKNKTNVFVTNNPMKNRKKVLEIAASRSGKNSTHRKRKEFKLNIIEKIIGSKKLYRLRFGKKFFIADHKNIRDVVIKEKFGVDDIIFLINNTFDRNEGVVFNKGVWFED